MLFVIIIVLVIALHLRLSYLNKKDSSFEENQRYLAEDYQANFSRTKPIDEHMFINLSEDELPFRYDYDDDVENRNSIINAQEKVSRCLASPIIKTDILTNLEIKKRFGTANLQTVIDGEENHTLLIRGLNTWARLLIEAGNEKDAGKILEKALDARSDISETYTLLYGIYAKEGNTIRLNELITRIEALPEIPRKRVESFISSITDKADNI